MYDIGIKDERVLAIVSKMLKAPIQGVGIPTKGTPQGGILSPLLANIALNEMDWWISDQWETFETEHEYSRKDKRIYALKRSELKEMYIVRYADDFKIFTRTHDQANRVYHAIKGYLKSTLKLYISKEKSKVINLRKKHSEFLGFKLRARKKKNKYIAFTNVADKRLAIIKAKLVAQIKTIQKNPTTKNINKYNSMVMGIKNYFQYATHISIDFGRLAYQISRTLRNRFKSIGKYEIPINPRYAYAKNHQNSNAKAWKIGKQYIHNIGLVKWKRKNNFTQKICNYTREGRELIHKNLKPNIMHEIAKIMERVDKHSTAEFVDNRISVYSMQQGICRITQRFIVADELEVHHIKPRHLGGTDKFDNLVAIHKLAHKIIHATKQETIDKYLGLLQANNDTIYMINVYREPCGLEPIPTKEVVYG